MVFDGAEMRYREQNEDARHRSDGQVGDRGMSFELLLEGLVILALCQSSGLRIAQRP